MATNFGLVQDNFTAKVSQARSSGDGTLILDTVPSLSPAGGGFFRLSIFRAGVPVTILKVTGVSGTTMTISGPDNGHSDADCHVGDQAQICDTSSMFSAIHTAVNALETDTSKAIDSLVVHLAGTESITGSKTFSSVPTLPVQTNNTVFSGPETAGSSAPIFRALVAADIPSIPVTKLSTTSQSSGSVVYLKSDGSSFETNSSGFRIIDAGVSTRAPNLIGGYSGNVIDATCIACTISGGGQSTFENKILNTLGTGNHEYYMVIGGGYDNQMDSAYPSTISGGAHHRINMLTPSGGVYSPANPTYTTAITCDHSNIGGGSYNAIFNAHYATISGGSNNIVGWDGTNQTTSDGATVGGGVNNYATGLYATVVGGTGNQNTGAYSVVGGNANVNSGSYSTVFGTQNNCAVPQSLVGGSQHTLSTGADFSTVGGFNNTSSGKYSVVLGRQNGCVQEQGICIGKAGRANKFGQLAHAAGNFANAGDAQSSQLVARNTTTDATTTTLGLANNASSQDYILAQSTGGNYTACAFRVTVVAQKKTAAERAYWVFTGLLTRDTASATTAILGGDVAATTPTGSTSGATAWTVALVSDTTNGALKINVTGASSTNIRWVATVEFTEVGNP